MLLHYSAAPELGGVEAVMESQRRILVEAGYPVRVIAGRGDCEVIPELDSRHPAVEDVTVGLAEGRDVAVAFDLLVDLLGKALSDRLGRAEIVIAHNVMTMHFNLPLTAALAARGRVLAWTHDVAWSNRRYAGFRRTGHPYTLLHTAAPRTRYVAISRPVAQDLHSVYSVEAAVVPNGIDRTALLRIRPETMQRLRGVHLDGADPLILVPFRVTRRKRLELALRALALILVRHPRARLVVSGPLGPHSADNLAYWSELDRLRGSLGLQERVVFLHELGRPHQVDAEMVGELYQLASLVLLTSEAEGFGLPMLEAGLARVPVVCTDLGVFNDIAGDSIWTFPIDSAAE
ncbi:MAG: glycosyltransferase family 4 protein, partial [Candidatus Dormibacteraeota bacterium]|nr:glycosyltransferase family 4 protein [Candidatus Dormibacteraeota bacterium]